MPARRKRWLIYRRAAWVGADAADLLLENCLRAALQALPNIEDNRIERADGKTAEIRHYRHQRDRPVHVHIAAYTPGEDASAVPIRARVRQADLATVEPPDDMEFMDGDLMMRVSGNDVVMCPSGLKEAFATKYLYLLFQQAGLDENARNFELLKVADIAKAEQVAREGVREITLDAGLYEEAIRELGEETIRQGLGAHLRNWIGAMFENDPRLEELQRGENINAKIVISFDGRRRGGELGQERLESIADQLIDEEEAGYTIETREGTTIRADELSLRKRVEFRPLGKSISYDECWDEIDGYFAELGDSGALEH